MGRVSKGICNICGSEEELTDDHLPPKSLYPKSVRGAIKNLHTVRACYSCNNGSKIDDEIFKVIIGSISQSYWDGLVWESTKSTLSKNHKLGRMIEFNTKVKEIDGNDAVVLRIDGRLRESFVLVMERIAKGLYFNEFDEALVKKKVLDIFHPDFIDKEMAREIEYCRHKFKFKEINDGTCRYLFSQIQNGVHVLFLELFNSIFLHFAIIDIKT